MKESAKENMPKAAAKAAVASGAIAVTVAAAAGPAAQAAPPAAASPGSEGAPTAVTQSAQTSPGVAKLKKLCDGSDAGICKAPKWTEEHLQFDSVLISRYVSENWPQIDIVGGWRPSDPYPDHPSGRAVDIMVPNGGQGNGKEVGQEIADYFQEHAKEFGVDYILWRQQSWSADSGSKQWKAMEDRGDPTSNHVDHVHITVHGDKSTIAEELIAGAGDSGGGEAKTIAQSVNDSAEAAIIVKAVTEEQA
jgi:hypothetical protein